MAYIKYQRGFRSLPIYKNSSSEQREVLLELAERIQYAERVVAFGSDVVRVEVGDLYFSRPRVRECLNWCGVTDTHIRNMIKKLVGNQYMVLVKSSKNHGSIYRCLDRFFDEIAIPFDDRKLTNDRPTIDQRLTNDRPTIDQRKHSDTNSFDGSLTNDRPTIDQRLTDDRPTIDHSRKNKEKEKEENTITISENSIFELEKVSLKSDLEIQRKKVAAKKESFEFPAAPVFENPLDVYFGNEDNIKLFQKNFPLLDMKSEFLRMRDWLGKKAAEGNPQNGNFRGFVVKWLNNSEKQRLQMIAEQTKLSTSNHYKNGKSNNWAAKNGKRINGDAFAALDKLFERKTVH
jgi:hypothetical protein